MLLLAALKASWWPASSNSMRRTALRAAADAERWAAGPSGCGRASEPPASPRFTCTARHERRGTRSLKGSLR